ncbi:MAG: DinB family protein [Chitinophagaceae bacterium]|nr:MAG: DinB family protein [Chitinophagaceae bacterium]
MRGGSRTFKHQKREPMNLDAYFQQLDQQEAEALQLADQLPPDLPAPAEGRWSPLQELEHICLTEALVRKVLRHPSDKRAGVPELFGNQRLEKLVVAGRKSPIEAPEYLHPKGRLATAADFGHCFRAQRAELKEDLGSGRILPDDRTHPHPVLGELTIADWLYFLVQHTQRHLVSLRESLQTATSS